MPDNTTLIYQGFAIPADDHKFQLVLAVPQDVESPVFQLTVLGPEGGAVEVPDEPIPAWQLFEYLHLPLGYPATIIRIK